MLEKLCRKYIAASNDNRYTTILMVCLFAFLFCFGWYATSYIIHVEDSITYHNQGVCDTKCGSRAQILSSDHAGGWNKLSVKCLCKDDRIITLSQKQTNTEKLCQ